MNIHARELPVMRTDALATIARACIARASQVIDHPPANIWRGDRGVDANTDLKGRCQRGCGKANLRNRPNLHPQAVCELAIALHQ
jgi:hypothetical protein